MGSGERVGMRPIPYGRHAVSEGDIAAVVEVLRSDWLTQGPAVEAFESAFAAYVQAPHAIAVANGTAALHLSALALGFEPGRNVVTTPITFAATANCACYAGCEVVFADIDPDTHLLDPVAVDRALEGVSADDVAAIIPVDLGGRPVDLQGFRQLADTYRCRLLEDACHAPGGAFTDAAGQSQPCGNGVYADASVFSFHPVKHIAAGEGGMVTTASDEVARRIRMLRCHGIERDGDRLPAGVAPWYYEMQALGYNYRLTDIQAALGLSQLRRAPAALARRRELAARYLEALQGQSFLIRPIEDGDGHARHLFILEVADRDGLYAHLRAHGILPQVHYIPLHLMPFYRGKGWGVGDFPHAEAYYRHALSLPLYPSLTDDEQGYVIDTLLGYYKSGR